jgi:hypothetical protein
MESQLLVKEEKQFLLFDEFDDFDKINLESQKFYQEAEKYKTYTLPKDIQFETSNDITFTYYFPEDESFKKIKGKGNTCKNCKQVFKFPNAEEKLKWQSCRLPCPRCHYTYCTLPDTEKVLKILQERYYESNRDVKILYQIQSILKSYAKSMILREKSPIIFSIDQLDYYAQLAASFLIEEYFKNENFRIDISFGSYLGHKVKQALYTKSEWGAADTPGLTGYSLDYETDEISSQYLARSKQDIAQEFEKEIEIQTLRDKIINLIKEFEQYCNSPYENFMRLLGLRLFFFKSQYYSDKFFNSFNRDGKIVMEETLQIINKFLSGQVCIESNEIVNSRKDIEKKIELEENQSKFVKLTKEQIKEKYWEGVKISYIQPKPKSLVTQ